MASQAETFVVAMIDQISGPAASATSALDQLEARIAAEREALGGLQAKLGEASAALQTMGSGSNAARFTPQFQEQQAVVEGLRAKIDAANGSLATLESARGPAELAAPMQRAEAAITEAAAATRELQAQLDVLQGSASADQGAVDALTAAIARQRGVVNEAQQSFVKLGGSSTAAVKAAGGSLGGLSKTSEDATTNLTALARPLARLGGPAGQAGAEVARLGGAFQKLAAMGPAGLVAALSVAAVALAAALAYAAIKATEWALSMADAARSQRLAVESTEANYKALSDLHDILPGVQARTGLTTEAIDQLAQDLAKAHVSAGNMAGALNAMASAKAGGANAEYLAKLQAGLVATGKILPELSQQFEKFEDIARRKMLSLDQQSSTFKRNVGGLFSGIKIEGFLEALSKAVALFDSNTAAGHAMKAALEAIFQPMIDGLTAALPYIEVGMLKMMAFAVRATTAIRHFFKLEPGPLKDGIEAIGDALGWVSDQIGGLSGYVSLIAIPFKIAFTVMMAPVKLLVSAIGMAVDKLRELHILQGKPMEVKEAKGGAAAALEKAIAAAAHAGNGHKAGAAGAAGLAAGIASGKGAVDAAARKLAEDAYNAMKARLGIASPSREFAKLGAFSAEGYGQGFDQTMPEIAAASAKLVANDVGSSGAKPMAPGVRATGDGKTVQFNSCTFGGDVTREKVMEWVIAGMHEAELDAEPAAKVA